MKTNDIILNLISQNATVNDICKITGLSHKQLFYRMNMLKIKGYDFAKKHYYSGDIVYDLNKSLIEPSDNEVTILTSKKDKEFKAFLISDLHLGNIYGRPDLLYKVYEMCINDGVHIIINTGDLIDGPSGCGSLHEKITLDIEKQIESMLKNHPFDKNILNFICLGNHDLYSLKTNGINLRNILENKRHDLISLGYGYGTIKIKNDIIYVKHPTKGIIDSEPNAVNKFILTGHSHQYKQTFGGNDSQLYIPSLSELTSHDSSGIHKQFPSLLKINIEFINGVFNIALVEHLIYINDDFYKVSETQFEFKGRNKSSQKVNNEEELKKIKYNITTEKEPESNQKKLRLSQTEKFNKKWNR